MKAEPRATYFPEITVTALQARGNPRYPNLRKAKPDRVGRNDFAGQSKEEIAGRTGSMLASHADHGAEQKQQNYERQLPRTNPT
jgi:hypothetical protein